jgi:hypothetical protein
MQAKEFLESVLGSDGFYCTVGLKGPKDNVTRVQRLFDNLDDAISEVFRLDAQGFNAYHAQATFETDKNRKQENAKYLKSFYLDIDCGDGPKKDFLTQAEALIALKTFCKAIKLPKPTIVNSGYGLHVYWRLTEQVPADEWLTAAKQFKQVVNKQGMKCDQTSTSDSARILRTPGTHNYKNGTPRVVELVGELAAAIRFEDFRDIIGAIPIPQGNAKAKAEYDPLTQISISNYQHRFKTILIKSSQSRGCPQILKIATEQATMPEPLWRAGLSIAAHCIDRDVAIHKISERHPQYNADETTEKANRINGPYICDTFNTLNPDVCPDCQHWKQIKSPIVLGREVKEADEEDSVVQTKSAESITIPKYPFPYFRGANGGIYRRDKDKDGDPKEVLVYHNDLYVVRRIRDPEAGESVMMRLHLPRDGIREFTVPLTSVTSRDEFRKVMSLNGVAVINPEHLMHYTTSWVNQLQNTAVAYEARRQFGWVGDKENPMQSFVIGSMEIFPDRIDISPPSVSTAGLVPLFQPEGSLEKWKELAEVWNKPEYVLHQFMFCTGFGSLLMELTAHNGGIFSFTGKSGKGKSTGLYLAASLWGDPMRVVMDDKDTFNSKMNRAEVYKNILFPLDEVTNTSPMDLSTLAYAVPSGNQKNRMSSNGNKERYRGKPWKFLCVCTSNFSLIQRIGMYKALPKAEALRIIEIRVPDDLANLTKEEQDNFYAGIQNNFGHAGPVYAQYILNNVEECKKVLAFVRKKIDEAANLQADERFWSSMCATTIAGVIIAKKAGLINYDVKLLTKFILGELAKSKEGNFDFDMNAEQLLSDYMAENYNNILRIKSTDDARKQSTGLDHLILPDATPRMQLVARYEYDIKKLYLLPKPFKLWCSKQQIDYSNILEALRSGRTKAMKEKVRLGKGTHMNMPAADVWTLLCPFMDTVQ